MDLCNLPYLSDRPLFNRLFISHGQNFNTEHFGQTVQPNSFTPAIHVFTIHLYHFMPLSVTLHGQCNAKLVGFIFCTLFNRSG